MTCTLLGGAFHEVHTQARLGVDEGNSTFRLEIRAEGTIEDLENEHSFQALPPAMQSALLDHLQLYKNVGLTDPPLVG